MKRAGTSGDDVADPVRPSGDRVRPPLADPSRGPPDDGIVLEVGQRRAGVDSSGTNAGGADVGSALSATARRFVRSLQRLDAGPDLAPSQRIELIAIVGARLCLALTILMAVMGGGAWLAFSGGGHVAGGTAAAVLLTGAVGGFVSLQRRLKTLGTDDLILLANSWVYVVLSPMVGGILAILLYVLFISGLVDGDLFPTIVAEGTGLGPNGSSLVGAQTTEVGRAAVRAAENQAFVQRVSSGSLADLFGVYGASPADYAKILFWCFLGGYSERFVTNIISQFETGAGRAAGSIDADAR